MRTVQVYNFTGYVLVRVQIDKVNKCGLSLFFHVEINVETHWLKIWSYLLYYYYKNLYTLKKKMKKEKILPKLYLSHCKNIL